MCYDIAYQTKRTLDYAKRRGYDDETIKELEERWKQLRTIPHHYHVNGFQHPQIIAFPNEQPLVPQTFYWGLIPFWVKDAVTAKKLANQTLNARGETIFEKPSFRDSAKKRRCLIMIDHFYEHHHHNGKAYPFLIKAKNDEPLLLAGLWSEWVNQETGEIVRSATIVTTHGNRLMSLIHNNPKLKGPRMPLIIPREKEESWLMDCESEADKKEILDLIKPLENEELLAYPVNKLRGNHYFGDVFETTEPMHYPELEESLRVINPN